ncbi:hypothetical protein D6779_11370 [Candidatus Parcubacteria bacterium]|nr:MAG: hypothetical protein D6779_11370 [Candidatus Parcubacteria bacterium]
MRFPHPKAQWEWDPRASKDDPDRIPYCKDSCPFYEAWQHPYYKHTVFCWHVKQNLSFHDGIIAACMIDYKEGK